MPNEAHIIALAGNPNVGKSTVFNALTGLRQHTGNWPGKTVAAARGDLTYGGEHFTLVDLPGTYSLFPTPPRRRSRGTISAPVRRRPCSFWRMRPVWSGA